MINVTETMKMHLGTSLTDQPWSDFFAESDSKTGEEFMKEMNLCVLNHARKYISLSKHQRPCVLGNSI